jgi:hypothetical protein
MKSTITIRRRIVVFGIRIATLLDAPIVFRVIGDVFCAQRWHRTVPNADVNH